MACLNQWKDAKAHLCVVILTIWGRRRCIHSWTFLNRAPLFTAFHGDFCIDINLQTDLWSIVMWDLFIHPVQIQNTQKRKIMTHFGHMKETAVCQKELRLNLSESKPSRAKEGEEPLWPSEEKEPKNKPKMQACPARRSERGREGNRERERKRGERESKREREREG